MSDKFAYIPTWQEVEVKCKELGYGFMTQSEDNGFVILLRFGEKQVASSFHGDRDHDGDLRVAWRILTEWCDDE